MLMPKKVKRRKQHRGRMTGKAWRGSTVSFGDYGMKAMEPCWLTARQIEAARALGLSKINTFIKILGPQILKHALPGLGNVWQITLKDTALISVTGLVEIMRQSRIAANVTHSPLTFYLSAAVLYLILTTFSSKAFNKLENYSNKNQVKA